MSASFTENLRETGLFEHYAIVEANTKFMDKLLQFMAVSPSDEFKKTAEFVAERTDKLLDEMVEMIPITLDGLGEGPKGKGVPASEKPLYEKPFLVNKAGYVTDARGFIVAGPDGIPFLATALPRENRLEFARQIEKVIDPGRTYT